MPYPVGALRPPQQGPVLRRRMPGGPLDGTRAGIADVTAASGQDGEVTAGLVALALSPLKLAATLCGEGPARSPPPPKLYQDYLSTPEVCTRTSRAARAGRAHSSTEDAGSRVKRGLDALMQIEKLKDRYSQHMQAASKAEELANDIDGGCKGEGANDMKARPPAGPAFRGINSASKPRESPSGSVGIEQLRSGKVPAAHRPERAETASAMARRSPPSLGGHSSRASSNEPLKVCSKLLSIRPCACRSLLQGQLCGCARVRVLWAPCLVPSPNFTSGAF